MKYFLIFLFCFFCLYSFSQTSTYTISGTSLTTCAAASSTGTGTPCGFNYDAGNIKFSTTPTISGTTLSISANKCTGANASGLLYLKMANSSALNDIVCGSNISQSPSNVTLGTTTSSSLSANLSSQFTSGTRYFTVVFVTGVRSNTRTFSVTATPPTCPTVSISGSSFGSPTTSSLLATWSAVSTASQYEINVTLASNPDFSSATTYSSTSTSRTITGLSPNTSYKFQARALCSNGVWGNWSPTLASGTTIALTCATPSGLSTSNITETGFTATWSAVSGASSYSLESVLNANGYAGNLVNTSTNSYTFSNIPYGTYKFQVQTNCFNGISSAMSGSLFNIALTPPLNLPVLSSPISSTTTSSTVVSFNWSKNGNPTNVDYQIRIFNVTDNIVVSGYDYVSLEDISSTTVNLLNSKEYRWVVRARKSGNLDKESAPATFFTPAATCNLTLPAINSGSASNLSNLGFTANWPSVVGATEYQINVATFLNTTYSAPLSFTGSTASNSINVIGLTPSTQYRFQIRAKCSNGVWTSWSPTLATPTTLGPITVGNLSSLQWHCNKDITWSSVAGTGNVTIELWETNIGFVGELATNIANSGIFTWLVGKKNNNVTEIDNFDFGLTYYLKMYPHGTNGQGSQGNGFTIPQPTMLVTSPAANSNYTVGQTITMDWGTQNLCGPMMVELTNTAGTTLQVMPNGTNIPNVSPYTYTVTNTFSPGSYKLKIYPAVGGAGAAPVSALTQQFNIVGQSVTVSSPNEGFILSIGGTLPIAWNFTGYNGPVSVEITPGATGTTSPYPPILDNAPNDGTETYILPNTIPAGQYRIKVYNTGAGSNGNPTIVNYSGVFTIRPTPNCPNCITGQTVANFTQTGNEGFCAAQYLCSEKIIRSDQSASSPTAAIFRQDVAKMTLISLLDNPSTVDLENNPNAISFPADNFPVPYNDLSGSAATCCGSYHRYAKVLSYLDYGDGMPPFVRRASFKPLDNISRVDLLQVYLESYNIDENAASGIELYFNDIGGNIISNIISNQQRLYLQKAVQLGLVVNGTQATPIEFRPNDAATREEAFLILKRLRTSTLVTKPSQVIVTTATSYFTPANLTPQNMSIARGLAQGNFSHYSEDGFGIADIGVSLGFGFNYQSFLTEIPDEWKIIEPLGRGWTHGLNAHIFTTISSNDATAKPLLVVAWGDGTYEAYDNTNIPVGFASTELPSHVSKISIGNYNILSRPSSTTYTIKKKDQSLITFTSQGEPGLYRLSSVSDKNSNTLSVVYKTGEVIPWTSSNKVIDYVQAPSGRRATFTYNSNNYITNISFPGSTSTTPRNLTFTYNGRELKTFKDARGQVINKVTTYNYGTGLEAYLLKEIILPKGNKVVNEYNLNRKLKKSWVFSSNGNMTNNTNIAYNSIYNTTTRGLDNIFVDNAFDTNGLPTSNTNPFANINIQKVYDTNHPTKIASFTSKGVTTTSTYYANGNIDQINYPASIGGFEKFTFDAYNNPLTHRDAKGIITTMTYPDNKNLGSVTKVVGDGTNITQTFTYWPNGLPKTSTNNEGIVTNFSYNAYGNLNSVNIPILSLTMTANYDYASRKTSVTNFKNQTSKITYDENDNTITETDAQNHATAMAYDDNDNPITITNAKGKITTLTYDAFDRNNSQTFEGSTNTFIFDDATNRLTEFRKAGYATDNTRRFVYSYDINTGLLKSNGYIQNIDYDTKNRMSTIRGGNNANHQLDLFTYDDLNRLQSYRDFYGFTVSYGYDLNANVTRIDYPNGNKLYKTYDNLNRLKTLTWNTTPLITYNYVGSRLDNMVYGNTVKTAIAYDNAGRPNGMNTKTNNGTGSTIFASTYTMDNLGNHLGENETHPFPTVPLPTAGTTNYVYNSANRITSDDFTSGNTNTIGFTYNYDNDGNISSKSKGFGNESTFGYDLDDNLINYTKNTLDNNGQAATFSLSAIYDALGNRRSVTRNGTETRYVLDINGLATILAETNANNVVQNYYIHGLGLVARIKADGTIHYYHSDFRGSTIALTNASQAITHKYQYDEFGNLTNSQEADPNPFRYVGAYGIMYETPDLCYMRARYYDPTTGRFNSEDPIWSTNMYPYAGNNGVNRIDKTGESYTELCLGWQATTGIGYEEQECVQISGKGISTSNKVIHKASTTVSVEGSATVSKNKGNIPTGGKTFTSEGAIGAGYAPVAVEISTNSNNETSATVSAGNKSIVKAQVAGTKTLNNKAEVISESVSFKIGANTDISPVNVSANQMYTNQDKTVTWKEVGRVIIKVVPIGLKELFK